MALCFRGLGHSFLLNNCMSLDILQMCNPKLMLFAEQVRRELYGALTPMQRLSVARHPNRPTFLDHVMNMTDSVIELTRVKLHVSSI